MATFKIARPPKVSVIPSAEDRANADAFDQVAASLGLAGEETRGRRWLLRIGALLQRMRIHADLKQETMAKAAGVTQAYLSRLENGRIPKRGPTIEVLLRCAAAADCDIEITLRSRKDRAVSGAVSSHALNDDEKDTSPFAFPWKPLKEPVAHEPAVDALRVIFAPAPATGARLRATTSHHPINSLAVAESSAKIEQAQATLTEILKALDAYLPTHRHSSAPVGTVQQDDLGPLSTRAASELVQALEVVWPLRARHVHFGMGRRAQAASTVTVGAGDLVVIGGTDLSAESGSVRVLGAAAEFVKDTESEA